MAEINYTLTHIKDVYYILNEQGVIVNYIFKDTDPCTADDVEATGTIAVDENFEVIFPQDGYFQMVLTEGANESNIYFKYYLNLQLSMIEDIFTVLCPCDCGCSDCVNLSTDQYKALLTARNKIDIFKYLVSPKYDTSFTTVHKGASCLIEPKLYCDIDTEGVTGLASYNQELTKQLIALDYLAMYFTDLKGVTDQDEIDYINSKYQSESILCCINKLGINIKEIETLINDMATITMDSGAYVNLPPDVVGDNTLATDNRTTLIYTMAMFTTGTTPPYNDPEGDAADAVRVDTLPVDGELQLNAVAVTPGQIISKVDIDNNLFTFVPPDQDGLDQDTWTFSVRDTGSGQFSS